uniref:Putative ankyrin repeat protein n=1 Tax=Moumouvirus sp. 'Monve' TaxID=1128131 RepID=H2EFB2_9VIRU|nr:putative ankyrin repeat protein [Moumouvirus Monve]
MDINTKYFKIIKEDGIHFDHKYVDGLNVINGNFQEEGKCVPGRLYFTTIDHLWKFLYMGTQVVEIYLPTNDPEFKMINDTEGKYGANKIILGKKYKLDDPFTFKYLIKNGFSIQKNYILIWALERQYFYVIDYILSQIKINKCHIEIFLKYLEKYIFNGLNKLVQLIISKIGLFLSENQLNDLVLSTLDYNKIELLPIFFGYIKNTHTFTVLFNRLVGLNNLSMIKNLISSGADYINNFNFACLESIRSNNFEQLKFLFSLKKINEQQIMKFLNYAMIYQRIEIIDYLLEYN